MMWWLWDNSITLATVAMGLAAIAALVYAHLQISDGRKAERRANANELWRETLRLAFENPKLSDPSLRTTAFDYENLTIDGDPEFFQKYEMYVDTILNASEEILAGLPTPEWDAAVRLQLKLHREYLLSPHFQGSGYLAQYTPEFREYMDTVLKEKQDNA
jgi:hypothetical protein